jgi:hypothetical protein
MMQPSKHFKQLEGVLRQEVSGTVVLFNMESGRYYSLNDVGARAWELCDGTRSISDITGILAEEYDAPEATIQEDVANLLSELCDERLLLEVHTTR